MMLSTPVELELPYNRTGVTAHSHCYNNTSIIYIIDIVATADKASRLKDLSK